MGRFQGRGRSWRSGRGGRSSGRGRSNSRSSNSSSSSRTSNATKTKLEDQVYRVGSANQASDYVTVTRFIIAHIKEKYTKGGAEIAWALENEEDYDLTPLEPAMDIQVCDHTGQMHWSHHSHQMV